MTSRPGPSPARARLSRLPGWVPVLGAVLVLGELTGGAVLLAGAPGGLAALGGETRTVVLEVDGGCAGDSAAYTSPAGDGHFDMSGQTAVGSPSGGCVSHGSPTNPPLRMTLAVPAGGTVTISTFNRYGDASFPLICLITMHGAVLNQVSDASRGRATCRAKIP